MSMHRVTYPLLLGLLSLSTSLLAESDFMLDQTELRALLKPVRYATLSAEMSGKIAHLAVREGDHVAKGALLVKFDCSLQQAQLKKARSQLSVARNTYKGNQRMAELNAIGHVELANSQLEVETAGADVEYLIETLKRCELHSPYPAAVGDQLVQANEFIQAGSPLLEVMDDSELQLEFIVPSRWLAWLKNGYAFEVEIVDTQKRYPAKLSHTAAKVDAMSQSIKVIAFIDGNFPELRPGMSGRVQLNPPAIQ